MAVSCHLLTAHGVSVDISSHGWNMDRQIVSSLGQGIFNTNPLDFFLYGGDEK